MSKCCRPAVLLSIATCLIASAVALAVIAPPNTDSTTATTDSVGVSAAKSAHSVRIRAPEARVGVLVDVPGGGGGEVLVACGTCHATRAPQADVRDSAQLDEFHQGLRYSHGRLSCLSCHNVGDYDTLRLADGTALAFADVQTLCGQCHGPQMRDYRRGSHGGMAGHWDLTRGPRDRLSCVNCHDPHDPRYPKMRPTFKPRDRFLIPVDPHSRNFNAKESHSER